jgi:hypothetical protein
VPDTLSQALPVQSVLTWQPFPTAQAPQVPPPQSMSVSAPSLLWSTHVLLTHLDVTKSQALLAQPALPVQVVPSPPPTQAPLLQVCPLMHALPQTPQLRALLLRLTSQPSAGF